MKPFYVKAEGINHEKQQELLDLAVDAGATLGECRQVSRHDLSTATVFMDDWDCFGINDNLITCFDDNINDVIEFGDNAVEMTYNEAWEYVTGIIRVKESREETIDWLRENTTVEDWASGDLNVTGWTTERELYRLSYHLVRDGEIIEFDDVFMPHELQNSGVHATPSSTPAIPRSPLFDRVKQALGSREVEIAGEDHLVGQVKGDAHKAQILDKVIKEFNIYPGQNVINALLSKIPQVAPVSPKPIVDRSKPRNKYDHEIIPGVHVDVYDVLNAFPTGGADIDHAVKKLLKPGGRGHKDEITDCEEAIKSIQRRIDHIKEWGDNRG